ncbi:uncharacterized protein LOC126678902 [Mercurialis annua]|uniref:uncharacterized protein LOC126678902 n=1 Tax=Mercurialis annua TaxID=3986 RepID=UPI00215FF840|nr:uncharacterized protein LOC126678902 [Mercurialis annua]
MAKVKEVPKVERRLTRSQTKPQLTHQLVTPPVSARKVSAWAPTSCPGLANSKRKTFEQHVQSLPEKRLKREANVRKRKPEIRVNEHDGLEDELNIDWQTLIINDTLKSLGTRNSPVQASHANLPSIPAPAMKDGEIGGREESSESVSTDEFNTDSEALINSSPLRSITVAQPSTKTASYMDLPSSSVAGCRQILQTETDHVDTIPSASLFVTTQQEMTNSNSRISFGLTEMVAMCGNEDSDMDEVDSSAKVTIPGTSYMVKEELAPIIKKIIEVRGDIAAHHIWKTLEGRSMALENLADFFKQNQTKKFHEFSEVGIQNALNLVYDFSSARLDVGWLQQRLEDILHAKKLTKEASTLKKMRETSVEAIKKKKRELEQLEKKMDLAKKELEIELAKGEKIKIFVSNAKAEVKYFIDHLPLDGLF